MEIELPSPPTEVADILLKVRRGYANKARDHAGYFEIMVAADPDAIRISRTRLKATVRGIRVEEKAERARKWAAVLDPIVYVIKGKAVAIIVQFGKFPIEKQAVEDAIAAGLII